MIFLYNSIFPPETYLTYFWRVELTSEVGHQNKVKYHFSKLEFDKYVIETFNLFMFVTQHMCLAV